MEPNQVNPITDTNDTEAAAALAGTTSENTPAETEAVLSAEEAEASQRTEGQDAARTDGNQREEDTPADTSEQTEDAPQAEEQEDGTSREDTDAPQPEQEKGPASEETAKMAVPADEEKETETACSDTPAQEAGKAHDEEQKPKGKKEKEPKPKKEKKPFKLPALSLEKLKERKERRAKKNDDFDFDYDAEYEKVYNPKKLKKEPLIILGGIALFALAVLIGAKIAPAYTPYQPAFDEVPVYDRLQSYPMSEAMNDKGVGSPYTRCDESVDALITYNNRWPADIISHEVTELDVEDDWSYEVWSVEDYYGEPEEDDTQAPTEEVPAEPAEGEAVTEEQTPDVVGEPPVIPGTEPEEAPAEDDSLLAGDVIISNTDADDGYVIVDNKYCKMTVTEFVDLPGIGFEMYSILQTSDVPEDMSFESTIHLSQYWEKEHQIVYIEELEANSVYEIYTLVVTDDWVEDVYIVYMATTSALYLYDEEDSETYREWCGVTEFLDSDYGYTEAPNAPSEPAKEKPNL